MKKTHADIVKTALSGAKISWKIHCQWYWMPGVFNVPVNPSLLNVVSNDTCICYFVRFSFACHFERETNPINFISQIPLHFDIVNLAVIHKGQIKKTRNSKVKPNLFYNKICRKIISSILCFVAHICHNNT